MLCDNGLDKPRETKQVKGARNPILVCLSVPPPHTHILGRLAFEGSQV